MNLRMGIRLDRMVGVLLTSLVGLFYASTARADELSNVDLLRLEFGYSHVRGDANQGLGTRVPYVGGASGPRLAISKIVSQWFGFELDLHLHIVGIDSPVPDAGLAVASVFAPLRWKGTSPGSLVFGAGLGAAVGRPMWMPVEPSANAFAFTRFMVLPTSKTRLQIEYRITPISTLPLSKGHWALAHDADMSFGKNRTHFGVRGRFESISAMPSLVPGSSGTYRSWWIGPFIALVVK